MDSDIILLVIGMTLLTIGYAYVYQTYLSRLADIEQRWLATTATIEVLRIRPVNRAKLFYEAVEDYKQRVRDHTHLDISYQYRVQGRSYSNNRIDPTPKDGEAHRLLNSARFELLSAQDTLEILYNPSNPSESYIKQDYSLYRHLRWLVTGVYVALMLIAIANILQETIGIL